jgi:hypothetical protein
MRGYMKKILIIFSVITVFAIALAIFFSNRLEVDRKTSFMDSKGIIISECVLKNEKPWDGTFIEDEIKTEGNYYLEYYKEGKKLIKGLHFIDGEPVLGLLGYDEKTRMYKMKFRKHIKDKNNIDVNIQDSSSNTIMPLNMKYDNDFCEVTFMVPSGDYLITEKANQSDRQLLRFNITGQGKIVLK